VPRRASYSLETVQALPAQAAGASAEVLRRQMLAAESLIPEIDPKAEYALSETLAKVLGAPTLIGRGQVAAGRELIGDLTTLILDFSEHLGLRPSERPGGAATLEELAQELGVASKTLQRWRRVGLCAHWVFDAGKARVAIYREALGRFAERHPAEFERARSFRRFDADERRALIEEGRRLVAGGLTLNLAAKQVAAAHGRSHEGVRLLFLREIGSPVVRRRSASDRCGAFAERAWRMAIEPSRIAARLGKSESFVRAIVDRRRAEVLRTVQPAWVELATFDLPGADDTVPNAPAARKLQPLGLRDGNLIEAIESARAIRRLHVRETRVHGDRDETRAAAMHYLLRRASRAIDALPRWPERSVLDQIETDLRTALRLRTLLVERGLVLALGRADHFHECGPERLPSEEMRQLGRALSGAVREVVSQFDPSRQRFDRAVSLAADYALAKRMPLKRQNRAGVRHNAGVAQSLLADVAQWQTLVDPLAHRAAIVAGVLGGSVTGNRADARLVARRYGFCGEAPKTIEQLAQEDRTTVALMTKRLRDAEAAIRRA
jgi:hypothetical protein